MLRAALAEPSVPVLGAERSAAIAALAEPSVPVSGAERGAAMAAAIADLGGPEHAHATYMPVNIDAL